MDSCTARKEKTGRGMARSRRETTRCVGNLFFEMSRPVESPEMLKSWVEWFRRLHIPCAIARTEAGYTLWRKGKEVGRRRSKVPCVPMDIVYAFDFTPMELNLLKEIQQERNDESCSQSSEEFEDLPLSHWEEPQEGLAVDTAALSSPGRK
jgi:hypothetical protein